MDRSRADEILKEWSEVAGHAHRPSSAPAPHMTRTALPAGLMAAATLAVLAIFVFGLGPRSNAPGASGSRSANPSGSLESSPSAARSLPTTIASTNPSAPSFVYSANPSLKASVLPTPAGPAPEKAASVVASLPNCEAHGGWPHAISGSALYVACYDSNATPYVAVVNMTTNAIAGKYPTDFTYIEHIAFDGGGLWVSGTMGPACVAPCIGFRHTIRIDPATGKTALNLSDWTLRGDGFGYIWATSKAGVLTKLDPATGAVKGEIPFTAENTQFACGSLWGLHTNNPGTAGVSTTISRVDPAAGGVLATFTEPGEIGDLAQIGSECWAAADSNPDAAVGYTNPPHYNHFDRIGLSSIEFRSPTVRWSQGSVAILDGTFWQLGNYYIAWLDPATGNLLATMQRIDPATWKPVGTIWTYTGGEPDWAIGGAIWAGNDRDNSTSLQRLDVPMGPIGS